MVDKHEGTETRLSSISMSLKTINRSFIQAVIEQFGVMLKRNLILQIRHKPATLAQTIVAPFLFHLVLFILQQADFVNQRSGTAHPPQGTLQGVSPCQGFNRQNCIMLMYYPPVTEYTGYMSTFATLNKARSGNDFTISSTPLTSVTYVPQSADASMIYPVQSQDFIINYTLANPNVTKWAITFNTKNPGTANVNVRYQIWFNASLTANSSDIFGRELVSLMRGIDEAIITNLMGSAVPANLDYQMKDWPKIPATTVSDTIVQALGSTFFFCSEMVIFINVLNQIVSEKESKLRLGMEMMGLKPCVYWLSIYISTTLLVALNSLITVIFGIIFQFKPFLNTDFGVMWITFFLFGESMVMFAFFISTLVRQSRVAVLFGIFIFIIGLLFQSFVFSSSSLGYIWWNDALITPVVWQVLILIPFFNFGHMFLDITTCTTGYLDDLTQTYIPGPGFPWSQLSQPIPSNLLPSGYPAPPNPIQAWHMMILDIAIYIVLMWYFDNVLPNEYGTAQPPWFFVLPSYWGYTRAGRQVEDAWLRKLESSRKVTASDGEDGEGEGEGGYEQEEEGDDVRRERLGALTAGNEAVKIVNLRKVFRKSWFYESEDDKVALQGLCLSLPEGRLLALLGQNGAGKSTAMSILAGLSPATAGDALIYGLSVKHQIGRIRRLLGVCPQHDILFDDLTANEHIELYAGLKGVPRKYWNELFEERLKAVKLWTVRNVQSGTYSGGMKRRLSLLISTIGDPRVIFMDEPTTGMDPVNRRHVWSFVENFKKNRVIVLTTHSMEEADVLGDRIAIMAHGRLRAIGNSIALKAKYGAGYRISVITSRPEEVKGSVAAMVPNARLEDDSAGALIYQFPITSTPSIPAFVEWLERHAADDVATGVVRAWGISQTTLEEVFLKLIRDANPHGYQSTIKRK